MFLKDKKSFGCMVMLTVFMGLFPLYSLVCSPNSAYKTVTYELFHLKKYYGEIITPVSFSMILQVGILIGCAWGVCWAFSNLELPTVSVVVPLFILLTVSVVLMNYVRRSSNAWKHFGMIFAGIIVMIIGCFLSKTISYSDYRTSVSSEDNSVSKSSNARGIVSNMIRWQKNILRMDNLVMIMIQITAIMLYVCVIYGIITNSSVNGAYGIISFGGGSFTPVELLKLLIMLYTGIALVRLRLDVQLRKKFYLWLGISLGAVLISKDFGNLIILLSLAGLVLYLLDNKKSLLIGTGFLAGGIVLIYLLINFNMLKLPASLGYTINRFESVFTTATEANANSTRQAMLAALRDGIGGSGPAYKMYLDNVFMIFTDYAFLAVQSMFGIGISTLLIVCYVLLYMGPRIAFKNAGEDPITYVYANTLTAVLGIQTIIHLAVNLNIFPYTGVILPFISAGGTSTVMCFLCLGLSLGVQMGDVPYKRIIRWFNRKG